MGADFTGDDAFNLTFWQRNTEASLLYATTLFGCFVAQAFSMWHDFTGSKAFLVNMFPGKKDNLIFHQLVGFFPGFSGRQCAWADFISANRRSTSIICRHYVGGYYSDARKADCRYENAQPHETRYYPARCTND